MEKYLKNISGIFSAFLLVCTTSLAHADITTATATSSDSSPPTTQYHHLKAVHSSSLTAQRTASGHSVFIFDPRSRHWAVYNSQGKLLRVGNGSGGRNYCSDLHRRCHSPVGTFRVYAREGARCKSSKFPVGRGGAPMPYCSYFHGGFAVHGSYEMRSYNASHGCIRVHPADAKWLQSVLPIGSTVIIRPY